MKSINNGGSAWESNPYGSIFVHIKSGSYKARKWRSPLFRHYGILLILLLFLSSCSTCRVTSIEDARYYESLGYETRIVVYKVGTDGLIMGLGLWTHHAQAQALVDGEWKWIGNGLTHESLYSIDGEIYYWQPSIYEAWLKQNGKYN